MRLESFRNVFKEYLESWEREAIAQHEEIQGYKLAIRSLRAEIKQSQSCINIPSAQICEICGTPAASEVCYVFPCGHCVHEACLRAIVVPMLDPERSERLFSLEAMRLE